MASEPSDPSLYKRVKKRVEKQFNGVWSAYASGQLVQQYKKAYKAKHGPRSSPYIGTKSAKDPLLIWFKENWVDVTTGKPCGSVKTKGHYPTCRPKKTRATMSPAQRRRMHEIKQQYGSKTAKYPRL